MAVLQYRQAKGLVTRVVDGEAFVISRRDIKHLNSVASIIWLCLTEPSRERDVLEILSELYPEQAPAALRADIRRVLKFLKVKALVSVTRV
jgi:hypothetical protein